jgi:hypothetical protein
MGMWGEDDFWKGIQSKNGANALIGLGTGLLQGNTFAKGLAAGGQGFMQGAQLDQQYADEASEEEKRVAQINQTAAFLRAKGAEDLAAAVEGGMTTGADAFNQWYQQANAGPAAPIKVGAGETLLDPTTYQPVYQGAPDMQDQFGNEKDLYAQYAGSDPVKMYETVKSGYERVRQSAALQTGAGDMGLIYGYMKMLDPGSVVRESEFATAAQAGSYGEQIQGLVSRVINGERLPESVRQEFVQLAEGIYSETAGNLGNINDQFTTRAQNYGVDPTMFIRQPESYKPLQGIVTMPNGNTVKPL